MTTQADLENNPKRHDTFVGVDSDGCVFDTMRVKQCDHFFPLIISFWKLEWCAHALDDCAKFVNLRSKTRGSNRFKALLHTFELLHTHPDFKVSAGVSLPKLDTLRAYVTSGLALGNPSLKAEAERTHDPELERLLAWSLAINADIHAHMQPVKPFHWAHKALEQMQTQSDIVVVSQTPEEALVKEWDIHHIRKYVSVIAGQELGTKTDHLRLATGVRYDLGRVLMIGDAPGDLLAAKQVNALFYPIIPDHEESAWERFCKEAYPLFLASGYAGNYERTLIHDFETGLPDLPPWHHDL